MAITIEVWQIILLVIFALLIFIGLLLLLFREHRLRQEDEFDNLQMNEELDQKTREVEKSIKSSNEISIPKRRPASQMRRVA